MTDPDRGSEPHVEGASGEQRAGGPSRRRRKGKRKGSTSPAALAVSQGENADGPGSSGRSENGENRSPRKRKRRRKGGATQSEAARAAGSRSGSENAPSVGDAPVQNTPDGSGKPGGTGKKRRRSRGKRSRHVRPLAPSGSPSAEAATTKQGSGSSGKAQSVGHPSGSHPGSAPSARQPGTDQPASARGAQGTQGTQGDQRSRQGEGRFNAHHAQAGHAGQGEIDLYAALDLGTNNCRLLIAQPTRPGQFRVVDAFSRIVRLGEGFGASKRLSEDAMDRAVEALKVCATKLNGRKIRRKRLIATEACRSAENGELFLSRVVEETGLELEIINRETEARLAVSGCSSLVGRDARSVVLFDIGGGSSEIAVIRIGDNRSSRLANHITHWTSLPVGVVTLSERHGGRDVSPEIFEAMVAEVAMMLGDFDCPPLDEGLDSASDFHLIGTSGTVTTLAGVHLDLPRYDRRRVDGLWLSDAEVSAMQAKLLSWGYADRAANACIGPDRADLVLAGCAILEAIRRRWPSTRMRVADRGLREGLLTDMMADDGVWRRNRHRSKNHRDREH